MAVYGPVRHQKNIIWTEASICYIYSPLPGIDDNRRIWLSYLSPLCLLLPETFKLFGFILRVPDEGYPRNASYVQYLIALLLSNIFVLLILFCVPIFYFERTL
jgi:hypothetical protein